MNPSDWIKAATLVAQHKQEAAITETDQLSSIVNMYTCKVYFNTKCHSNWSLFVLMWSTAGFSLCFLCRRFVCLGFLMWWSSLYSWIHLHP